MGKQRLERRKRLKTKKKNALDEPEKPGRQNSCLKYLEKNYKMLMIFPLLLLVLALIQIGYQDFTTGDFINKGVSLKGGLTVTIPVDDNSDLLALEKQIEEEYPELDFNFRALTSGIGATTAAIIQADLTEEDEREQFIEHLVHITGTTREDMNVDIMGPTLGDSFFRETIIAVIIAFFLMGGVVFLYFRTAISSLTIILKSFSNIAITIAIINLLGINVSTAGVAAFLMIIGYSIDTDVLLATRVFKEKKGDVFSRIITAAKTGLTMTTSTLVALIAALFISQSPVLNQIMTILLIGLLIDIINTWILNAGLLRYYIERKGLA